MRTAATLLLHLLLVLLCATPPADASKRRKNAHARHSLFPMGSLNTSTPVDFRLRMHTKTGDLFDRVQLGNGTTFELLAHTVNARNKKLLSLGLRLGEKVKIWSEFSQGKLTAKTVEFVRSKRKRVLNLRSP